MLVCGTKRNEMKRSETNRNKTNQSETKMERKETKWNEKNRSKMKRSEMKWSETKRSETKPERNQSHTCSTAKQTRPQDLSADASNCQVKQSTVVMNGGRFLLFLCGLYVCVRYGSCLDNGLCLAPPSKFANQLALSPNQCNSSTCDPNDHASHDPRC